MEIVFNENTTPPLDIGGNYKVVSTTVNGKDTMYFYSALNVSGGVSSSLGDTLSVGAWSIKFVDINVNQEEMLVDLTYPSGLLKQKTMEKNSYYIMYVDANGNEDFEPFSTYPESRINELLESGVRNLFVFTPTGFFVGIGGAPRALSTTTSTTRRSSSTGGTATFTAGSGSGTSTPPTTCTCSTSTLTRVPGSSGSSPVKVRR